MKKIYYAFLCLISVTAINAQLNQTNHAPAAGESYQTYMCDTVAPGVAGSGVVWNFTGIKTYTASAFMATHMAAAHSSTSSFSQANVSVSTSTSNVAYYNSNSGALLYYGGNISAATVKGTISYTAPAVSASYPMNLNTTTTSAISGSLAITQPLSTTGTFSGSSNAILDGVGTANFPAGMTFTNVMRVKTSQTIDITTQIANANVWQVNYNYYAPGIKAPIFTIMTATATVPLAGTSSQTVTERNLMTMPTTNTTSISNADNNVVIGVFPNPASSFVSFISNSPEVMTVNVFDITGKKVDSQILVNGQLRMDVSSYNEGLYIYSISTKGEAIRTGKLTVNH